MLQGRIMSRAMPFAQIRTLTQLRNLLSETLESFTKSSQTTQTSGDATRKVNVDRLNQLVKLLTVSWWSTTTVNTNNKRKADHIVSSDESVKDDSKLDVVTLQTPKKTLSEFVKEQDSELEKALMDWAEGGTTPPIKHPISKLPDKPLEVKQKTSKSLARIPVSIESRSRFLIKSLLTASSPESQLLRLEDLCKHLLTHPEALGVVIKEHALRHVLNLREKSSHEGVQSLTREALTLLGYTDPPPGSGIRILSVDGGGTRGIMAIEIVRQLEQLTGCRVHELFDYICGVSTGAILTILFGGMQMGLDECERLYQSMSGHVFNQNALLGTSRLVWSHAYYDTTVWEKVLRDTYGEGGLTEVARRKGNPKIAAVSAIMNQPLLKAYMFRSYNLPYRSPSNYMGGCNHKSWEAIRASAAAPGYFQEYCIGDIAHQDGGLMWNNPTALAIHEAQLLWPKEQLACVVSLGTGRYVPPVPKVTTTSISLKTKMLKILDSATDTEGVHSMLHDLLPPNVYFRFNPYLTESMMMDENRPEKLQQLKTDAQMYLRKNEHKLTHAAAALTKPRSRVQKLQDWLSLQATLRSG